MKRGLLPALLLLFAAHSAFATLQPIYTSSVSEAWTSVDWSFQHNFIAAAARDNTGDEFFIFRWSTNSLVQTFALNPTNQSPAAVAWSRAANRLVVGFDETISGKEAMFAHVSTNGLLASTNWVEIGSTVSAVAWRPAMNTEDVMLGTKNSGGEFVLYSFTAATQTIQTTINYSASEMVNSNGLAWHPAGRHFSACFEKTTPNVAWLTNSSGTSYSSIYATNRLSYEATSAGWSPDGQLYAIGYQSTPIPVDRLHIFRITNNTPVQLTNAVPAPGQDMRVHTLQWGPFNNLLAVGGYFGILTNNALRVYRVNPAGSGSLELLYQRTLGALEIVQTLRWSYDQKYLAVGTRQSASSGDLTIYKLISADLGVRKFAAPVVARPGSNLVYSIIVTNSGPDNLTNSNPVTVTDRLPTGLVHVASTSTYNGAVSVVGQDITVTFPVFRANTSAVITVTALVATNLRTILTNRVEVSAFVSDPSTANNTNVLLTFTDFDGDGFVDVNDFCPELATTNNLDFDGDRFGDACDNCPAISNASQADVDFDLVGNACDNCPTNANPDQADADLDGFGDLCDTCPLVDGNGSGLDADSDGIDDDCDNCLGVPNSNQADSDGDGIGSACDNCVDDPNPGQADLDNDGLGDLCDLCPSVSNSVSEADSDADGIPDVCDPDLDGDLLPNDWEAQYGFNPFDNNIVNFETYLDPDIDGYTNLDEYIAGSNPTDPWSMPAVSVIAPGAGVVVGWPSVTGRLYDIYVASNLSGASWLLMTGGVAGTGGDVLVVTTNVASERHFRYEVKLAP